MMKSFEKYLLKQEAAKQSDVLLEAAEALLEYKTYKNIPNTNCSYREDPANTSTLTQKHSHVYAMQNGNGNEMYSVNYSGSGHDGSRGVEIPSKHADFFRDKGYCIPDNNILECVEGDELLAGDFKLLHLED